MKNILIILIILLIILGGIVGLFNNVSLGTVAKISSFLSFNKPLGVSLTTITSATLVSDLATILPANFTALNDGKIENSSTSIAAITTLQNLTSVGTISTGVWSGTAINVNKGGTGSTTLAQYQVLLGSSTNAIGVVSGFGTTGQFLTSNGANAAPSWQTSSIALGDAYVWTNLHTFSAGFLTASSTMLATTTLIGRLTSNTASTTIYNDLKVMGSSSLGVIYGGKYPCIGQITGDTSSGAGAHITAINCGFAAKQVQLTGMMPTVPPPARSSGMSDGTNHYSIAEWSDGAINVGYASATSSLNLYYKNGGSNGEVYASTTMTATGFNLRDLIIGPSAADYIIQYMAW